MHKMRSLVIGAVFRAGALLRKRLTLCMILSAFASSAMAQATDGLVGCWQGDGNADDVIHGNNGVLEGSPAPGLAPAGRRFYPCS